MLWLLIIGVVIFIIWSKKRELNLEVKWKTFPKKGFLVDTGPWGVYCYCGKQGTGKTYSVIEFLHEYKDFKIYANVKSLEGIPYIYIRDFQDLLNIENDTDSNIIIFYDEIFTALSKNDKLSKEVLSFLSQMRKRQIIFLTTAQEWLEINITLRRYVRFQIECSNRSFFGRSYLIKTFYDAEQLHWDNLENDYIAPIISTTISKMLLSIANSYDTYETIESSNKYSKNFNRLENERYQDNVNFSNGNKRKCVETEEDESYIKDLIEEETSLESSLVGKFDRDFWS